MFNLTSFKRIVSKALITLLCVICTSLLNDLQSQSILNADGPSNTYELINSVLAPGYTAVEAPDQCTSHPSFGRHVAEVFDVTLNQFVFEFYIHVPTSFPVGVNTADNDRCLNFDRQRVEIKTYESSPDSLKGTTGETITYKWKFRLPSGFQPSPNFTHIHQIKAVGGDDGDPLFTLTPRYSASGNTLQLLYVLDSLTSASTVASTTLSSFLGVWVEATEQVKVGTNGTYTISLKRVSDGSTLLTYTNNNIATIRPSNTFIRPKWGIYRSLLNSSYLRDDSIRIANILIFEGLPPTAPTNLVATATSTSQINLTWFDNSNNETSFVLESSLDGITGWATVFTSNRNTTTYSHIGLVANTFYYYRIRADNPAGISNYSSVASAKTLQTLPVNLLSFNAVVTNKVVQLKWIVDNEINVKLYQLEWSKDGINYSSIGIVNATASNTQHANYSWQHQYVTDGDNYYRIKIIDNNGSYKISTVQLVNITNTNSVIIYPNPTKDFVLINLKRNPLHTSILVLDITGKVLQQMITNNNKVQISLQGIAAGIYFIKIIDSNNTISNYKFMITNK